MFLSLVIILKWIIHDVIKIIVFISLYCNIMNKKWCRNDANDSILDETIKSCKYLLPIGCNLMWRLLRYQLINRLQIAYMFVYIIFRFNATMIALIQIENSIASMCYFQYIKTMEYAARVIFVFIISRSSLRCLNASIVKNNIAIDCCNNHLLDYIIVHWYSLLFIHSAMIIWLMKAFRVVMYTGKLIEYAMEYFIQVIMIMIDNYSQHLQQIDYNNEEQSMANCMINENYLIVTLHLSNIFLCLQISSMIYVLVCTNCIILTFNHGNKENFKDDDSMNKQRIVQCDIQWIVLMDEKHNQALVASINAVDVNQIEDSLFILPTI